MVIKVSRWSEAKPRKEMLHLDNLECTNPILFPFTYPSLPGIVPLKQQGVLLSANDNIPIWEKMVFVQEHS